MADPYAQFGGKTVDDPYAAFGGGAEPAEVHHTAGTGRTGARLKGTIDENSTANTVLPSATAAMIGGPVLGEAASLLPLAGAARVARASGAGAMEFGRSLPEVNITRPFSLLRPAIRAVTTGIEHYKTDVPPPTPAFPDLSARRPVWQGPHQIMDPASPPFREPGPQIQPITPPTRLPLRPMQRAIEAEPPQPNPIRAAAAQARLQLHGRVGAAEPAPFEPIRSPLPSGRMAGAGEPKISVDISKAPVPPADDPELLDGLSVALSGKSFAKLAPSEKEAVRAVAQRGNTHGAATPPTAAAPAPIHSPAAPKPQLVASGGKTIFDIAKEELTPQPITAPTAPAVNPEPTGGMFLRNYDLDKIARTLRQGMNEGHLSRAQAEAAIKDPQHMEVVRDQLGLKGRFDPSMSKYLRDKVF